MARLLLPTLAALGLLLAACADDDTTVPEATDIPEATDDPTTTTADEQADGDDGTSDPAQPDDPAERPADGVTRAGDGLLRDGVWAVGDAGTVEFAVTDAGLELIEVIAADGWSATVDEDSADEIEVDFRRGNLEYEIEIEYEGGILEIEIDLDIDGAEPGTFHLGPAGTITLGADGAGVSLDDLSVADGWSVTEQDTSDREVEVELRRGNVTWELEAEVEDGRLEIEIDFEIAGRYP